MLDEVLLYDHGDSPFCLKARICLQLKGVAFRRVTVTLRRRRELLGLNPLGKVPVLVEGGTVVADSTAIAHHLEAQRPEPPLVPRDPAARAYAALLEDWADEALYFLVGAFKWLNPENRASALANTVAELDAGWRRPFVARALVRDVERRYRVWGYTAAALPHMEERMRESLRMLATLLDAKPFLLGRAPTLADVAVFAQLAWMERYAERWLLDDVAVVRDWLARLGEQPAIAAALSS